MGECYGYTQPGDLFDPGSLEMSTNLSDKCKMVTKECHASEVLYLAECDLESLQLAAGTPKTTAATYPAVFGACDAYLSSTTTTTPTPVDEVLKSTEVPPGGFLEFGAGGKSGRGVLDTIGRAVTSAERAVEDAATRAAAGWSDSVEEDVSLLSDHSSSAPSSYNHAQLKFAAMQLGLGTIQHTPMLHFTCTDNKLIDQGVDFEHLLTAGAHNNSESVHNKGLLDNAVREVCLKPIEDNESTKYLVEGTEAQRGTSVQYDVNWFKDMAICSTSIHPTKSSDQAGYARSSGSIQCCMIGRILMIRTTAPSPAQLQVVHAATPAVLGSKLLYLLEVSVGLVVCAYFLFVDGRKTAARIRAHCEQTAECRMYLRTGWMAAQHDDPDLRTNRDRDDNPVFSVCSKIFDLLGLNSVLDFRVRDDGDIQWREIRKSLPILLVVAGIMGAVHRLATSSAAARAFGSSSGGRRENDNERESNLIKTRRVFLSRCSLLLLGSGFVLYLHGVGQFLCITGFWTLLHACVTSEVLRLPKLTAVAFAVFVFACRDFPQAFGQHGFAGSFPLVGGFLRPLLMWKNGPLHLQVNCRFIVIKVLSFGVDSDSACDSNPQEKSRSKLTSLLDLLAYAYFPPLYLAGPLIGYDQFRRNAGLVAPEPEVAESRTGEGKRRPDPYNHRDTVRVTAVAYYFLCKFLPALLFFEFFLHYMPVYAIVRSDAVNKHFLVGIIDGPRPAPHASLLMGDGDATATAAATRELTSRTTSTFPADDPPNADLAVKLVYWILAMLWLKFTTLWRFFRFWSLLMGVPCVENMQNCFNNNNTLHMQRKFGFWQGWHCSFNRWIIQYLYIPLGGRRTKKWNILPIFLFVGVWHDLEPQYLGWGLLNAGFMLVEFVAGDWFSGRLNRAIGVVMRKGDKGEDVPLEGSMTPDGKVVCGTNHLGTFVANKWGHLELMEASDMDLMKNATTARHQAKEVVTDQIELVEQQREVHVVEEDGSTRQTHRGQQAASQLKASSELMSMLSASAGSASSPTYSYFSSTLQAAFGVSTNSNKGSCATSSTLGLAIPRSVSPTRRYYSPLLYYHIPCYVLTVWGFVLVFVNGSGYGAGFSSTAAVFTHMFSSHSILQAVLMQWVFFVGCSYVIQRIQEYHGVGKIL
eukprot:g6404.t1